MDEQQQWIKVGLAFAQSPVQAALTAVAAGAEYTDYLTERHPVTNAQRADNGLVRGTDRAVVDADNRLPCDRASERNSAISGRQNGLTRLGSKINSAVAGCPEDGRRVESSQHNGRPTEWPASGRRQGNRSNGRSRDGQHAEANRDKDWHSKVSMNDSHAGSLRARPEIVQSRANLWMTFGGTRALWIDSPVQICHQI
jgi:hypothetical protein